MDRITGTQWIVERASSLGFDRCGVARAEAFPELAQTSEWYRAEGLVERPIGTSFEDRLLVQIGA